MADAVRIGSVKRQPFGTLADKAAERIIRSRSPKSLAVTLGPEGMVEVELFVEAVPDDVVGVYDPEGFESPRWFTLAKRITEDLRHHWGLVQGEAA